MKKFLTLLLCAAVLIGCSDHDINNAVSPLADETEITTPKRDNMLRITGYEQGDFIWKDTRTRNYEGTKGIYVATYQDKEVWLYGFFKKGELVVGTEIENPTVIDTWIRKVLDLETDTERQVRFIQIERPE